MLVSIIFKSFSALLVPRLRPTHNGAGWQQPRIRRDPQPDFGVQFCPPDHPGLRGPAQQLEIVGLGSGLQWGNNSPGTYSQPPVYEYQHKDRHSPTASCVRTWPTTTRLTHWAPHLVTQNPAPLTIRPTPALKYAVHCSQPSQKLTLPISSLSQSHNHKATTQSTTRTPKPQ